MMQMTVQLVGYMKKKGSGVLDGGQAWSNDHAELYVLTPLKNGYGSATTSYRIPDADKHDELARSLVGQDIILDLEIVTNGKSGTTFNATSFKSAKPIK